MNANLFLIAQFGFALLTVVYFFFFMKMIREGINQADWDSIKKKRVFGLIIAAISFWLIAVSVWSASGMMGRFEIFPINFAPVIIIPLVAIVLLTIFSKDLKVILSYVAPHKIIHLQNFRVFVELLLWLVFLAGMLPEQMTFEGRNFDVLSGLSAPLMAWLIYKNKTNKIVAMIWNLICLALLINIVTIAVLSTPTPWQVFFEEPSNTVVTVLPISFLPGFLVPLAYTLHFFSLKQLLSAEQLPKTAVS
jgi:hypothetical protein